MWCVNCSPVELFPSDLWFLCTANPSCFLSFIASYISRSASGHESVLESSHAGIGETYVHCVNPCAMMSSVTSHCLSVLFGFHLILSDDCSLHWDEHLCRVRLHDVVGQGELMSFQQWAEQCRQVFGVLRPLINGSV